MSIVELLAAPFAECLILVAIHSYLGIHVLKRRVIFVDLALAQIAALGTTVGFLFGIMPDTPGAMAFSILFTTLGAAVFSVTRLRHERIPQEAVIGLTYAIASAIAILVVEKTKGAEHIGDILAGNLLWVTWKDVLTAAAVYAAIGVVHFIFRRRFLLISEDPQQAFEAGMRVRAWDFLFYWTFGVVIAFSTRVAGVLMVFVFLVAPAILAFLLTDKLWLQLLTGWTLGTAVTVVGLYMSWVLDLPSGPAVIAFYGLSLVLGAAILYVVRSERRGKAMVRVALGAGVCALAIGVVWAGGRWLGSTELARTDAAREVEAQVELDREAGQASGQEAVLLGRLGGCVARGDVERYLAFPGPEEMVTWVRDALSRDRRCALALLAIALADDELPELYLEEVQAVLRGLDPKAPSERAEAQRYLCAKGIGL